MEHARDHFPEEIHQRILEAAGTRFHQYGYNKTTMAEIARDCDMSAANLYRYFENKLAIGAELAAGCLADNVHILKEIVSDKALSCAARLEKYILASLDRTYNQWSETPRINEMVIAICHERLDIVNLHVQQKQALLINLLNEGNQAEEFAVPDPEMTADAIHTATTLFNVPLLMPMYSRDAFERKAYNLTALLLNGLLKH
ncbi:MAG: TetR/AcrR family transcriptional regulator [Gammaproteobacteria bacterium]|jgi:AcrR family transcriptional regulator